jgi:hypothetical protein
VNGLVGFANIIGVPSDISGATVDFTGSGWVYGGAAMVGATYFLSPILVSGFQLQLRHDGKANLQLFKSLHQSQRPNEFDTCRNIGWQLLRQGNHTWCYRHHQ